MDVRELKPRMLVVCEGEKTEKLYFEAFPLTTLRVKVVGAGRDTVGVVKDAITLRDRAREEDPFDHVWVVFDRDGHRDGHDARRFGQALDLARREGIELAWSNEAFELWYLLHFEYSHASRTCEELNARLGHHLQRPYGKALPDLYERLLPRQPEAIRNAQRLEQWWSREAPHKPAADRNPATRVHHLVEQLNRHKRR